MIRTLHLVLRGMRLDDISDEMCKRSHLLTEFPHFQRVFGAFNEMPKHRGREDDQV